MIFSQKMLYFLVALNIGMVGFITIKTVMIDERLPIQKWGKVEVLNSPIKAGEDLHVRVYREKVRDDCPVASDRQAINRDGEIVDLPDAAHEGGASDNSYVDLRYPTPSAFPADDYTLRVLLTYTCPTFSWTTPQPEARFRVVE